MTAAGAFSALRAAQRAAAVLDRGTFLPLSGVAVDLPVVVGSGVLAGRPVLVAFTDGHVHGGTVGVRESALIARLAESAASRQELRGQAPVAFILGFDTGGVRVQEGPVALAAASAVGVALARLSLRGPPLAAVISGPRGCFGAMAVMAALPERIIMTADAHWGLTGPKLLGDVSLAAGGDRAAAQTQAAEQAARAASAAANRLQNGDAQCVVADTSAAVRAALEEFVSNPRSRLPLSLHDRILQSAAVATGLQARLQADPSWRATPPKRTREPRRRDLLRYSLHGQWHPHDEIERRGLVHAALGTLATHPALGLIVGPEQADGSGVGMPEAALVTEMLTRAVRQPGTERTAILTFLFCQGHAVDCAQERFGLHRALAECLRAMVAARLLGHPIVSILGGGTYGAAYLALAAPSHRILAMRGTSVAPMAPDVLRAFEAIRGRKAAERDGSQLAELIPDIRIVDSVIRLRRVLREELLQILEEGVS